MPAPLVQLTLRPERSYSRQATLLIQELFDHELNVQTV